MNKLTEHEARWVGLKVYKRVQTTRTHTLTNFGMTHARTNFGMTHACSTSLTYNVMLIEVYQTNHNFFFTRRISSLTQFSCADEMNKQVYTTHSHKTSVQLVITEGNPKQRGSWLKWRYHSCSSCYEPSRCNLLVPSSSPSCRKGLIGINKF